MLLQCWQVRIDQEGGGQTGKPLVYEARLLQAAFDSEAIIVIETVDDQAVLEAYGKALEAHPNKNIPPHLASIVLTGIDGRAMLVAGTVQAIALAVRRLSENHLLCLPKPLASEQDVGQQR